MKNILFYISGHGFGHATRSLEVIKQLQGYDHDLHIIIESDAAEWLFPLNLQERYTLIRRKCDIGAVQKDSYDVDKPGTLRTFADFYAGFSRRIPREIALIRKHDIRLIVGDIPPLAFAVAHAAGVPSIAITNFSWDWIYEPYAAEYPQYRSLVDAMRKEYSKADLLLQLPFAGDLSAFPHRKEIPLIARHATAPPEKIRAELGIPEGVKLILVAFRDVDLQRVDLRPLMKLRDFRFLFYIPVPESPNFIAVKADEYLFPNLVHAADVVVSKPGYGIVSECLANRTPLLFTSRNDFQEYEVLAAALRANRTGLLIPMADFFAGKWEPFIREILAASPSWPEWPTDGAAVAAREILARLPK